MIFKGNPLEAFSLSRLVQFNHIGEFTTEDEALIKEMTEKGFETAEGEAATVATSEGAEADTNTEGEEANTNDTNTDDAGDTTVAKAEDVAPEGADATAGEAVAEAKEGEAVGEVEAKEDGDLASLREEYKNKTGKKPFGGRTAEQIKEKMAE